VWIDGNGELRSKKRTMISNNEQKKWMDVQEVPIWNYDGSSTGQAEGSNSEITLTPCAIFNDPVSDYYNNAFVIHRIVLCCTHKNGNPTKTNNRDYAVSLFNLKLDEEPWFGLEQEYFIMDPKTGKPLGFDTSGNAKPQGNYYCGVGADVYGREIAEEHLNACISAGINIAGINAEVAPGQWEFQIGICEGIQAGDHLWVARYLLQRVAEKHNVGISFEPKPILGDWNGSGCHTNFSTKTMRDSNNSKRAYECILDAIERLRKTHDKHMRVYGQGNEARMTGNHETASYDIFTFSNTDGNRGESVRIGKDTIDKGYGYFEDRRPAANCDPYKVTSCIFQSAVLNNEMKLFSTENTDQLNFSS
jgi:glutamine synthetase